MTYRGMMPSTVRLIRKICRKGVSITRKQKQIAAIEGEMKMNRICAMFLALLTIFAIPAAALSTQVATITVDGDPGDWASLSPAYVDAQGDGTCGADTDIKSIYTAMDGTYAYVMVETYGVPINNAAVLEINFQYDFQNVHTNIFGNNLSAWVNGDDYPINGYTVAWGNVMEARIPLSELDNPSNFDPIYVNSWVSGAVCDRLPTTLIGWTQIGSQVAEYDQTDFPDGTRSVIMGAFAGLVSNSSSVDGISVTVSGIGKATMDYQPGWKMYWALDHTTPPGPAWQTTYRFESGSDFRVLDLSKATFRELSVPQVTISGNTISWKPVPYATHYEVWVYSLDSNGYPDNSGSPLFKSGLFNGTAYTLPATIPNGHYAVRVNAREYYTGSLTWWEWWNRSSFYKKISIGVPPTATVKGTITEKNTGKGISDATVSIDQGAYVLTTTSGGAFSYTLIPIGMHQVEISASNYYTKALPNVSVSAGIINDLSSVLTPKSPQILMTGSNPSEIYNDGVATTLLTADVTHPDGPGNIGSVVVNLAQIGGSPAQAMYDDGSHGDAVPGDDIYSYQTTVPPGTQVQQFSLNITATDLYGFKTYGEIELFVFEFVTDTVQPEQTNSYTVNNSLPNQTLELSFSLNAAQFSKHGLFLNGTNCYVELTVYRPSGEVYGVYEVTDSLDLSIPNAESGNWTYQTVSMCSNSVSYEIETKGSGTGMFVGRAKDAYTGLGIVGATVSCNTGGATLTLDDGYFTGVAVAGTDAAVISTASGYRTNVQVGQAIIAGDVTSLSIQMISEASQPQPAPSSQKLSMVSEPREDPDPLAQPFTAKELDGNLLFNVLFPDYQQPVNIYLGLVLNLPGFEDKLFLFKENNELVEFTDTLWPWRTGVSTSQAGQVLSVPLNLLPSFSCSLYSLVTSDPVSLSNYDIVGVTFPINQAEEQTNTKTMDLLLKKLNAVKERSGS